MGLSRHDLLSAWGFLGALRMVYESKARETADKTDSISKELTHGYLKLALEIAALQGQIDHELDAMEGKQ